MDSVVSTAGSRVIRCGPTASLASWEDEQDMRRGIQQLGDKLLQKQEAMSRTEKTIHSSEEAGFVAK